MNRFHQHHQQSISFSYSCFDRIIVNGFVPCFQHSKRAGTINWFLRSRRQAPQLNRCYFAKLSREYHEWVTGHAQANGIEIVVAERDIRREQWVEPYFQQLGDRAGIAVILKAREPERMAVHFARSNQIAVQSRFVDLYYFYLNDSQCGRMFLRICPYFPFNIRVWMNGHNWLARRLEEERIAFAKRDNLFVACARPQRLQELSDAFAPSDIVGPVETWLARLLPFFSAAERQEGFRHELFMAQMEYCHNLIFHKQVAAERLFDRLLDANRGLGHPDKLAIYFRRGRYQPVTVDGQTVLKLTPTRTPVLTGRYKNTSIKQYVSNNAGLRVESSTHQLKDLALRKNIKNMPKLRQVLNTANERVLDIQQDVLVSYVDRGQLQQLRQTSTSATGRRTPGLRVDDFRLIAVLQAITCFSYFAGKGCFRTTDLLLDVQKALGKPTYRLSQLRYDLAKLRGKGLLSRLAKSQSYQLSPEGYRIAILYLKLYQRLYAPLTAAIREPAPADNQMLTNCQTKLDRLYVAVDKALQKRTDHIGLQAA